MIVRRGMVLIADSCRFAGCTGGDLLSRLLDVIVLLLQWGLAPRHREVPRTLAACATSQSPCALNRVTVRCTCEGEYVVTGRRRQHLELELARHVAVEVSAQSERPALRFSRYETGARGDSKVGDAQCSVVIFGYRSCEGKCLRSIRTIRQCCGPIAGNVARVRMIGATSDEHRPAASSNATASFLIKSVFPFGLIGSGQY